MSAIEVALRSAVATHEMREELRCLRELLKECVPFVERAEEVQQEVTEGTERWHERAGALLSRLASFREERG